MISYQVTYFIKYLRYISAIFFIGVAFFFGIFFFVMNQMIIDFSSLNVYNAGKPSILLDDEGNEWARFQIDYREPVALENLPPHLIQAFIAAEDWQFFSHTGISIKGIIRSTLVNIYHGRKMQGASTITQQLVKLIFFNSKKTFKRKLLEQLYAVLIEYQCTKEQILQTYLNHIYFGCGIYGVEAACQRFWNCSATSVSVEQAALLAGIIRCPGRYCPLINPLSCQQRRNVVLGQLHKLAHINEEQYEQLCKTDIALVNTSHEIIAPHVHEMIRQQLEGLFGRKELYSGGLTIQTTINRTIQERALRSFTQQITRLRDKLSLDVDGALVSIQPETGQIKALVGGYTFNQSKFNRALQAKRQLGSIFKPIVYAAALEKGATLADTEIDEAFEFECDGSHWKPKNYNHIFDGQVTLAHALSHSNNIVAIKTFLKVGAPSVIAIAEKCAINAKSNPYPSLALGCIDVSTLQATALLNIFANDGIYVDPYCIKWVKDRWGDKIFTYTPNGKRVIASKISGQIAKALELGINRVRERVNDCIVDAEIISKTGTTNDSRTCWFVGSTPTLTTGIYIGCDDNQSLGKNVFPIHTAFPIWQRLYMRMECSKKSFSYDPSLKKILINEKTGDQVDKPGKGIIPIYW